MNLEEQADAAFIGGRLHANKQEENFCEIENLLFSSLRMKLIETGKKESHFLQPGVKQANSLVVRRRTPVGWTKAGDVLIISKTSEARLCSCC